MDEKKNKMSREIMVRVITAVIILLQLVNIIYVFENDKQGQHSDELWVYGLANSQNGPHIFMDADTGETIYENEWINGDVFKEYLTVSEDSRFDYGTVISNLKKDTAPPLYCILLHTVSSIFPGEYSAWYGLVINLVAFVVAQIFIYMLVRRLTNDDKWALLAVVLYGFSVGAVSTVIFIRHYMLLTLFGVMTAYYHYMVLCSKTENRSYGAYIGLVVSVLGGALSHYFYIVFLAGFALMYLIYMGLKKDFKRLVGYVGSIVLPLFISSLFSNAKSVLGFAAKIEAEVVSELVEAGAFSGFFGLLSELFNVAYNPMFDSNVNIVLRCIMYDMFGVSIAYHIPYWFLHMLYLCVFVLFGIVMLAVLADRREKERVAKGEAKAAASCLSKENVSGDVQADVKENIENRNSFIVKLSDKLRKIYNDLAGIRVKPFFAFSLFVAIAVETYIVIGFAKPFMMNESTNRYLFIIYPIISILLLLGIRYLFGKIRIKGRSLREVSVKILAMVAVSLILVVNNAGADSIWLFPRPEGEKRMEDMVAGSDCILVPTSHWLMTCYTEYLMDAEDIFVTDYVSVFEQAEELKRADSEEIFLIMDADQFESIVMLKEQCERSEVSVSQVEEYYMAFFEEVYEGRAIEYVCKDTVFQRNVYVYKIH